MVETTRSNAVLLVEPDPVERELYASALEREGFVVLACPGPTEPDYTCVGGREGWCPLVDDASVVVLDMGLDSEAVMMGTPAEELLGLYLTAGRPVVALGSRERGGIPGQLVRLRRHADGGAVAAAVRELDPDGLAPRPPARTGGGDR
jgi:hypothetical protein